MIYTKLIELIAVSVMLDQKHQGVIPLAPAAYDVDEYVLGTIGKHDVVIAGAPRGEQGKVAVARVAAHLRVIFPNLHVGIVLGIGGGVPSIPDHDVRLGDVVVGAPESGPSLVEYDVGKQLEQGLAPPRTLGMPPEVLLNSVNQVERKQKMTGIGTESPLNEHLARLEKGPSPE